MIIDFFQQQVDKFPTNIAIKMGEKQVTYKQLDELSNGLANLLGGSGVVKGQTVALYMARTIEVIVSKLAILKCGANYLPLDMDNPASVNERALSISNVQIVLYKSKIQPPFNGNWCYLNVDLSSECHLSESLNNPVKNEADDQAYIMFTSGSTGEPKGVMVPHRAVTRLVVSTNYIDISNQDVILQFAPLSFDASTFEIWGALLNGATLVLYSGEGLDPNLLKKEVFEHKVSIMWLTAALFHLIASRYHEVLASLHTLLAGGDVLKAKVITELLERYPHLVVINGYGPTENTTFTCCHRMDSNTPPTDPVLIGQAITGTQLHILDEQRIAVELGEIGELYVSGKGVALGYLGAPLKQDDFFRNSTIADGLIYRTGDLVKCDKYGNVTFIGRTDNQVKIRGYRVSLEAIRANCLCLPQISEAVVKMQRFDGGDQILVAQLSIEPSYEISVGEIKRLLAEVSPSYMIPDRINLVTQLKITKNGKVDQTNICIN